MTQENLLNTQNVNNAFVIGRMDSWVGSHSADDVTRCQDEFDSWLAAHDAEVRDKALTLTDDELAIAEGAYESSIMECESDGLSAMSIALKAVAEDRRNHEHRDR